MDINANGKMDSNLYNRGNVMPEDWANPEFRNNAFMDALISKCANPPEVFSSSHKIKFNLDSMEYAGEDTYVATIEYVNINGFFYPKEVFTGEIEYSLESKWIEFNLADEYKSLAKNNRSFMLRDMDEYFDKGRIPTFSDFVERMRIAVGYQKDLKITVGYSVDDSFILEGFDGSNIVDIGTKTFQKVAIHAYCNGNGCSVFDLQMDFEENAVELKRNFIEKEKVDGERFIVSKDIIAKMSLDEFLNKFHKAGSYTKESITKNLLMFISKYKRDYGKYVKHISSNKTPSYSIKVDSELFEYSNIFAKDYYYSQMTNFCDELLLVKIDMNTFKQILEENVIEYEIKPVIKVKDNK